MPVLYEKSSTALRVCAAVCASDTLIAHRTAELEGALAAGPRETSTRQDRRFVSARSHWGSDYSTAIALGNKLK